jgi:enamine deaminase RidA (YjgF/YER057c/UK114 family)
MTVDERLLEMGIALPEPPPPAGSYLPARRTGNLVFLAGQLPLAKGKLVYKGKLGNDLDVEDGYEAAKLCALNALSILKTELGSLDHIVKLVRVTGFVSSAPGFTDQPKVINGASEFLNQVLGEAGGHARVAIGVAELPLGAAVELELVAEVSLTKTDAAV